MNKKFLIGGAIVTALLVTACVKKETPKEEEQQQPVETTQQESAPLQELDPVEPSEPQIPTRVEVEHQESNNTSATIRREYHDDAQTSTTPVTANNDAPKAEVKPHEETKPKEEAKPLKAENVKPKSEAAVATPKASSNTAQTEDDAVAAAIAAATPALDK